LTRIYAFLLNCETRKGDIEFLNQISFTTSLATRKVDITAFPSPWSIDFSPEKLELLFIINNVMFCRSICLFFNNVKNNNSDRDYAARSK
jgi:hypothetical protein